MTPVASRCTSPLPYRSSTILSQSGSTSLAMWPTASHIVDSASDNPMRCRSSEMRSSGRCRQHLL